ncbi:gamma-butyrobetaine hydroxylase-like domain-containing protein [Thalassotalea litorea]|uniref:gamma-butyrobetaine hydroxylase-like domain-containing protein n=1 Tax=Thalassotalea litorea TaxID=2020715 RepID=UPI003736C404
MAVTEIVYNKAKRSLTLTFDDAFVAELSAEFLRVYSPLEQTSVKGKPKPPVSNKKLVAISAIDNVAKHGLRIQFDDQHQAVYRQVLLHEYAHNQHRLWQEYIDALAVTGYTREANIEIKQL